MKMFIKRLTRLSIVSLFILTACHDDDLGRNRKLWTGFAPDSKPIYFSPGINAMLVVAEGPWDHHPFRADSLDVGKATTAQVAFEQVARQNGLAILAPPQYDEYLEQVLKMNHLDTVGRDSVAIELGQKTKADAVAVISISYNRDLQDFNKLQDGYNYRSSRYNGGYYANPYYRSDMRALTKVSINIRILTVVERLVPWSNYAESSGWEPQTIDDTIRSAVERAALNMPLKSPTQNIKGNE